MISLSQETSMRKQFLLTLSRLFPDHKKIVLQVLADHLVVNAEALLPDPVDRARQDDVPDIDLDANPLDGDLPPADRGEWLDHSPAIVDGDPLAGPGFRDPPPDSA